VLPLSAIGSSLVDFAIASTVLAGLIAYFHATGTWMFRPSAARWFVPVVVAVQVAMMVGVGLMLAAAHLFYRDVRHVFAIAIQLWMFLTNVVYPVPADGSWAGWIVGLNPVTPIIAAYRDCVLHGRYPGAGSFGYAAVAAVVLLGLGWRVFAQVEPRFAEQV